MFFQSLWQGRRELCSFKKVKETKLDWIHPDAYNGKMSLTEILRWIKVIKRCWPSFHTAFTFSFCFWIAWVTVDTRKQKSHWVEDVVWLAHWLHEEPVRWNLKLSLGYSWIVSDVDWTFTPYFEEIWLKQMSLYPALVLSTWNHYGVGDKTGSWDGSWEEWPHCEVPYEVGWTGVDWGTRHPSTITVYAPSKSRWAFI